MSARKRASYLMPVFVPSPERGVSASADVPTSGEWTRTRPAAQVHQSRGKGEGFVTLAIAAVTSMAGCVSSKQPRPETAYSPAHHETISPSGPEHATTIAPQKLPATEGAHKGTPTQRRTCDSLSCFYFPSAADAVTWLTETKGARVLAFGEAHARKDSHGTSTALRFSDAILPALAPRAGFLLVELIAPPTGCEQAREKVQSESAAITEGQAEANQNDYITLGHRSRGLGVPVDLLRPSCAEFEAIASDAEPVFRMMTLIAELSARRIGEELARITEERSVVLTYGGALHNDVEPREGFEPMSFGPSLISSTGGKYVEIDLVRSEGLESSAWARMPWFGSLVAAARERTSGEAILIERGPRSYAIVLEPSAPEPPTPEPTRPPPSSPAQTR